VFSPFTPPFFAKTKKLPLKYSHLRRGISSRSSWSLLRFPEGNQNLYSPSLFIFPPPFGKLPEILQMTVLLSTLLIWE